MHQMGHLIRWQSLFGAKAHNHLGNNPSIHLPVPQYKSEAQAHCTAEDHPRPSTLRRTPADPLINPLAVAGAAPVRPSRPTAIMLSGVRAARLAFLADSCGVPEISLARCRPVKRNYEADYGGPEIVDEEWLRMGLDPDWAALFPIPPLHRLGEDGQPASRPGAAADDDDQEDPDGDTWLSPRMAMQLFDAACLHADLMAEEDWGVESVGEMPPVALPFANQGTWLQAYIQCARRIAARLLRVGKNVAARPDNALTVSRMRASNLPSAYIYGILHASTLPLSIRREAPT